MAPAYLAGGREFSATALLMYSLCRENLEH
jgi:hypothetical protein